MNKDKLQIGDLVTSIYMPRIGLVTRKYVSPQGWPRLDVYWFKHNWGTGYSANYLRKLEIPNE